MKKRCTYNRFNSTDIVVNESMRGAVEKLNWTCASTQAANPTPDAPKPIYSSGDGGKLVMWSHKKDYEPYTGSTTDIILPTGYVGGSLPNGVADTDTQKKIGKIMLNGSETGWIFDADNTRYLMARFYVITNEIKNTVWSMCDRFYARTPSDVHGAYEYLLVTTLGNGAIYINIAKSRITGWDDAWSNGQKVAAIKTWLSTNNVTVYYELATPVDITITKPQIPTYEGANTITTTNNIKPSLTIEAWKK